MQPEFLLALLGALLATTGLILQVFGLATPHWSVILFEGAKLDLGLWQICGGYHCQRYTDTNFSDRFMACRGTSFLGVLFGALTSGLCLAFVGQILNSNAVPPRTPRVALVMGLISFSCVITGVGLWASVIDNDQMGYSFYLSIAGAILYLKGSGISYLSTCTQRQATQYQPIP